MQDVDLLSLSSPLWTRAYAQEVDRLSAEELHLDPFILMEAAGRGVAGVALDLGASERGVVILSGTGNNGGDALVAARYLIDAGCPVSVHLIARGPEPRLSSMCEAQAKTLEAMKVEMPIYEEGVFHEFESANPVVIDGIFGIGFKGTLRPDHPSRQALVEIAALPYKTVLSVDLPSGLDVDIGAAQDIPLAADITVTFGGKKPAHILAPARDACGTVVNLDIGFPFAASTKALEVYPPLFWQIDTTSLATVDPWSALPPSAHKYDRGHILVIGGSVGKTGATILAGLAALRAGAGWATLALPDAVYATLKTEVPPELTFESLFKDDEIDPDKLRKFIKERRVKAMVIGPGCMARPFTTAHLPVFKEFTEGGGFIVFDAGATVGLADCLIDSELNPDAVVMTPHPGEWQRLAKTPMAAPLDHAELTDTLGLPLELGATIMYKGATPIILTANTSLPAFVVAAGTNTLGRAGSGDVLAGIIAAHGAIGLAAAPAAARAYIVMAMAAELAAKDLGEHAVLATDIINRLGAVFLEEEEEA